MNIETRIANNGAVVELIIESGNTKVREDISHYNHFEKCYIVEDELIENLITVSRELSQFNDESDVEFVLKIAEAFLSDSERQELIENLTNK